MINIWSCPKASLNQERERENGRDRIDSLSVSDRRQRRAPLTSLQVAAPKRAHTLPSSHRKDTFEEEKSL